MTASASARALVGLGERLTTALRDDDDLDVDAVLSHATAMHRLRLMAPDLRSEELAPLRDALSAASAMLALRTAEAVEREDQEEVDALTRAGLRLLWAIRTKSPRSPSP